MKALNFLSRLKSKTNICINVFCYENNLVYPVHISDGKFENCIDLLMITDDNELHCVYIKDFNRFMCNKTKNKNKNTFTSTVYNVLVVREFW